MTNNYFQRGNELLRENKLDEAIARYKQAIKQNPNIYVYYQNLGEALVKQDRLDEAITNYLCAIELNPNSACDYNYLGDILAKQGRSLEAINAYKMANKLVPNFTIFQDNLNKAIAKLKTANNHKLKGTVKNLGLKTEQNYLDLGDELREKQKIDEAINSYLLAIQINPESYIGYMRLRDLILYTHSDVAEDSLMAIIQTCQNVINQAKYIENEVYLLIARSFTELNKIDQAKKYCYQGVYHQTLREKPSYIKTHWDPGRQKAPDFILMGAQKSGTTSLYYYLNQHPQILPAIAKELQYFNTKLSRQPKDYYYAHFPPTPEDKSFITGEANPTYLYHIYEKFNVVNQIYNLLPDIKLITILRNPVKRAISNYFHWQKLGLENRPLELAIQSEIEQLQGISELTAATYQQTSPGYLSKGLYLFFLKQWLNVFPRNQILILTTEDFHQQPQVIINKTVEFLGLNKFTLEYQTKHNVGNYDPIDPSIYCQLVELFQPYNLQLEEYLGMKFNWD